MELDIHVLGSYECGKRLCVLAHGHMMIAAVHVRGVVGLAAFVAALSCHRSIDPQ